MKTLIFAALCEAGKTTSFLFDTWDALHAATFSPEVDVQAIIPLRITGKTYSDRKESARNLAIDVQGADDGGLSWSEYAALGDFFEAAARRYGLVGEFRENAII